MPTQTSAPGVAIHHMQKAFNVQLESSSVKYAISLVTSHQRVTKKVKVTTHIAQPNQEN